jgi:hypothetical protein
VIVGSAEPRHGVVIAGSAERRQVPAIELTGSGTCAGPRRRQSLMVIEATFGQRGLALQ